MNLHVGEIRHLCCWYFFLSIPFFALLSWDLFSGAVYSLSVACKWKGKVFKQKLLSPWLQLQVILRQINFRKQFEHQEIDSLKNTWFWEFHLKDNYYKSVKIRRMKIHNSQDHLVYWWLYVLRISVIDIHICDLDLIHQKQLNYEDQFLSKKAFQVNFHALGVS